MNHLPPRVFTVTDENYERILRLLCQTDEPYWINGQPFTKHFAENTFGLRVCDVVHVVCPDIGIIDEIAKLESEPAADTADATDDLVIVPCVAPTHRRINDSLVADPYCTLCLGLGLVRVRKEHVPVIHRRDDRWERGDDVVSRLADIS